MLTHRFPRRAGFTLLEVTLVVVIIFLLIIALIPAFRGKRAVQRYPVLPAATPLPANPVPTPPPLGLPTPPLPAATPAPTPAATPAPQ